MRLGNDWRRVLRHAWSVRLIVLAGLLSGVEVALPWLWPGALDGLFGLLSSLSTAAAVAARLLAQREFQ